MKYFLSLHQYQDEKTLTSSKGTYNGRNEVFQEMKGIMEMRGSSRNWVITTICLLCNFFCDNFQRFLYLLKLYNVCILIIYSVFYLSHFSTDYFSIVFVLSLSVILFLQFFKRLLINISGVFFL